MANEHNDPLADLQCDLDIALDDFIRHATSFFHDDLEHHFAEAAFARTMAQAKIRLRSILIAVREQIAESERDKLRLHASQRSLAQARRACDFWSEENKILREQIELLRGPK